MGRIVKCCFFIFGFFAIFKIEETKTEANRVLEDVKDKGNDAMSKIGVLQNQASELNEHISSIRQEGASFIADKTKEFETLKTRIDKMQEDSNESLEKIKKLLGEMENKNQQYVWSIEAMQSQTKLLRDLTDKLKGVLEKKGKEVTNDK